MKFNEVSNPHTVYTSPKGRPFRTFGISQRKPLWLVHIKYLDNGEMKTLFFDKNDKYYDNKPFNSEL